MDEPLYVGKPAWNNFTVVWMVFVLFVWALMILFIVLSGAATAAAVVFVPFLVLVPLVYYIALPRRFEVFPDRLEIPFGTTTWRIPFESITGIASQSGWSIFFYRGMRAGGWPAKTSLIETRAPKPWYFTLFAPAPDVIISAKNHDVFITALEDARTRFAASRTAG